MRILTLEKSRGRACVGGAGVSSGSGCTSPSLINGCVMGFHVTSGIVVDFAPGTSGNIYFSTLLNTSCTTPAVTDGCAIQTQQSQP